MTRKHIILQASAGIMLSIVSVVLGAATKDLTVFRLGFMIGGALLMLHLGLSLIRLR